MKFINIYALLFALCTVLISCEKRHINDNIPTSVINLSKVGVTDIEFYNVEGTYVYKVYATNAGFTAGTNTQVTLGVSAESLAAYNAENQTSFKQLPADCYKLNGIEQTITSDQRTAVFEVSFDCVALGKLTNLSEYVLPVSLSGTGDLVVTPARSSSLIRANMLNAELKMKTLGLTQVNVATVTADVLEYNFDVYTDFENKWDCDFEIVDGQDVLSAYNTKNNTVFQSLPATAYTIQQISKLEAGKSLKSFKVSINKSAIPNGVYAVGIQLKNAKIGGLPIKVNENSVAVIRLMNATTTNRALRTGWAIESFNSQGAAANAVTMLLDGNVSTFWESAWSTTQTGSMVLPYSIVVNLGSEIAVDGFEVWRRPDQSALYASDLKAGYFDVSSDGVNWKRATAFDCGPITNKAVGPLYFYCETVTAKYVRIAITESNRANNSNLAEFYTLKK